MKTAACRTLAQNIPRRDSNRGSRIVHSIPPLSALLLATLLCGCSSFNRDWRNAARSAVPASGASLEGRWEGHWLSEVNQHTGNLRCIVSRDSDDRYHARFRATYAKVLRFSYSVRLQVQPHADGWEFSGEENLGRLAGGVYYYEGRASRTNFVSTYRSKYDHGIFDLHRPE